MFPSRIAAVLELAVLTGAHMIMNTPVPYGKSTLNNSPLFADGSDFPCKQRPGVYEVEGASNTMALGSSHNLAFTGSATHGGGSCQVSITYDKAPTKDSVFKVIHSIEGGCPMKGIAGNNGENADTVDPDTYSFTIPTTLPTGSATLAWTWFNKIGNREMYMNCAPITITAGSSKRDEDDIALQNVTQLVERDTAAYNALPDMFLANIGNGCTTVDSTDVLFPNPGDSVEQDGQATSAALSTPTGSSCGQVVKPSVNPTAGGSGSSAPQATSSPSPASSSAAQATTSTAQASTSAAPGVPAPAIQGGVFATVVPQPSAGPAGQSTTSASTSAAVAASPSTAAGTGASGSGSMSGPCTTEGMYNCVGGTSFQQCASGVWSVVQQVAPGTSCTAGQAMSLNIAAAARPKRAYRFTA